MDETRRWQDWANMVLGVWLFLRLVTVPLQARAGARC